MTAPTRVDPVDWGELCEVALRLTDEAKQNVALLEIMKKILKRERENAAERETRE